MQLESQVANRPPNRVNSIDGRLYFHPGDNKTHSIVLSVKAGQLHANYVRDLRGVLEREKADIGVLLSFDEPTKPMRSEAASAGFYESPWGKHPRLQLLTVAELLDGKGIDYPRTAGVNRTYKQAPRALKKVAEPKTLFQADFGGLTARYIKLAHYPLPPPTTP